MELSAFDAAKADAYAAEAKARWGDTAAYAEYERKTAGQSRAALQDAGEGLMALIARFGPLKEKPASDPAAQALVGALRDYITAHFYPCTDGILAGLGQTYITDGDFLRNIDRAGGEGTAAFVSEAIAVYCAAR